MKTQLFFLAAVLCVSLVVAVPYDGEDETVTDEEANCISEALRQLEIDGEALGESGQDIRDTLSRLRDQRNRCEEILSDPPTAVEERLHDVCRAAWTASVAFELNRLRENAQTRDLIDATIEQVRECRAESE